MAALSPTSPRRSGTLKSPTMRRSLLRAVSSFSSVLEARSGTVSAVSQFDGFYSTLFSDIGDLDVMSESPSDLLAMWEDRLFRQSLTRVFRAGLLDKRNKVDVRSCCPWRLWTRFSTFSIYFLYMGWVFAQRAWGQRFFMLCGNRLFYFKDSSCSRMSRVVSLSDASIVMAAESYDFHFDWQDSMRLGSDSFMFDFFSTGFIYQLPMVIFFFAR